MVGFLASERGAAQGPISFFLVSSGWFYSLLSQAALVGFCRFRFSISCFYLICNAEQCISVDIMEMRKVPRVEK